AAGVSCGDWALRCRRVTEYLIIRPSPGDVIGSREALKMPCRKTCRFESDPGHHSSSDIPERQPPEGSQGEPYREINDAHDESRFPPLTLRRIARTVHHRARADAVLREAAADAAQCSQPDGANEWRD